MTQIPFCPSCEFFLAPVERLTRRNVYIRTVYAHRVTRGGEVYFVHPSKFMFVTSYLEERCLYAHMYTHICISYHMYVCSSRQPHAANSNSRALTCFHSHFLPPAVPLRFLVQVFLGGGWTTWGVAGACLTSLGTGLFAYASHRFVLKPPKSKQ